jgi:hypothetical protein
MWTRMNVTAKIEHVSEWERQNRVIKERARTIVQTLPYQDLPRKIRLGLIYYVIYWLNNVPKIRQDFSPRDIVFGEQRLDIPTFVRYLLVLIHRSMMTMMWLIQWNLGLQEQSISNRECTGDS